MYSSQAFASVIDFLVAADHFSGAAGLFPVAVCRIALVTGGASVYHSGNITTCHTGDKKSC
jgi:hypothetical protein